ncbi:MAG TPA: phosphopantetheine-binding protein, partial [Verrucomicrobiae bacterium]|nr:phosphopantetheine-binding protein [Verrucomicrobiae bacterium]
MTAPDSEAQSEVLKKAWNKAGVDPVELGFIEAHGSGTVLGDNIEIGGMTLAFRAFTDRTGFCPVSTIKSNIGHTRSAAGIAGLIKAVLSLQKRMIFPAVHFDEPHPDLPFARSAVYVNRKPESWRTGKGPRFAAVSSIGLSGTNCPLVLEEAPKRHSPESGRSDASGVYLLPFSSLTREGLRNNVQKIQEYLSGEPETGLADIAYTLGIGRNHYDHRTAFVARSIDDACRQLREWLERDHVVPAYPSPVKKLIMICEDTLTTTIQSRFEAVVRQYHIYRMLETHGIRPGGIVGRGLSKWIVDIIKGRKDIGELEALAAENTGEQMSDLPERIRRLIERETREGPVVFINAGSAGELVAEVDKQLTGRTDGRLLQLSAPDRDLIPPLVLELYLLGFEPGWKELYQGLPVRRTVLPGYSFEPLRCWLRETPPAAEAEKALPAKLHRGGAFSDNDGIADELRAVWCEVLDIDLAEGDGHFFMLGGDSLKASRLIQRIERQFGVRLDFEDVFDLPEFPAFLSFLESASGTEARIYRIWRRVLKNDDIRYEDNFFELGG